jgi:kinesin family protein 2/24
VIDLAGSESANDMQKHDKARMKETKQINISLNALKECIQARTLASIPGNAATTHVPFRRSMLTLLLKDVFDINCTRLTSTVVLATVNPMAKDVGQSKTTLGYAAPLREAIGMFGMNRKKPTKKESAEEKKKVEKKKKQNLPHPLCWK